MEQRKNNETPKAALAEIESHKFWITDIISRTTDIKLLRLVDAIVSKWAPECRPRTEEERRALANFYNINLDDIEEEWQ